MKQQQRATEVYERGLDEMRGKADRLFLGVFGFQWALAIVLAATLSPFSWEGVSRVLHPHVYLALFMGGVLTLGPALLVLLSPGRLHTRLVIAVAQILWSALLIHVTGGRIETHFHVFGSLAFLAFYRDWRVLAVATLVVAADHLVRGLVAPTSVYGIANPEWWRFLEHAGWVAFEDVVLVFTVQRSLADLRLSAEREARLEEVNRTVKDEVVAKTQALQEAVQQAEAANRSKSEFLANMSHEIRTPITAIQGFAELLSEPRIDDTVRLDHAFTIRRNGEHLLALINDILDLSKIEAGGLTVEQIPFGPAQIIADVESVMRVRATTSGTTLSVRLASPIPKAIQGDPTRTRQVLFNLVGNALKFAAGGRVEVVIKIADLGTTRQRLVVDVIDDGIGMAPEQLARLFQPFVQADNSTTRRFGGSGLGLVICRRLARLLGGEVTLASEVGKGTVATLVLPLADEIGPVVRTLMVREDTGPIAIVAPPTEGGRVLLAEDGVDNQRLIRAHLQRAGFEVTVVENGQLALAAVTRARVEGAPFEMILMDMQMPVMDGYSATAQLRALGCFLPIVALTAHAMAGDRERCLAAGCDDYLTKPIQKAKLLAAVAHHVAEQRAQEICATG